ncbi:MAG: PHP domain-containing protein, partial [Notoacmeibacter sp.]
MSRPPEFPRLTPVIPFVGAKPKSATAVPLYAELQCLTNFTFLEGASHAAELVAAAKALGHAAIGIADRNTLAGVVRAHAAAKKQGLRLLIGARLDVVDQGQGSFSLIAYPKNRAAYGALSRLITQGRRAAPKGQC